MSMSNPLRQQQWQQFRNTKRGFWSLIVFSILFIIGMGAEFIANDKPLLVQFDGQYYVPILKVYAETEFGGDFDTQANYRDEYVQELINEQGWMIWPLIPFHYTTIIEDLDQPAPSAPSINNWLGTDDTGRDVLARIIYGFRISVLFGFALTILSSIIGVLVGALQGFYGGRIDLVGQRFIEVWSGMPVLFILIILANFIKPNFWSLLLIMLLFSWMSLVDVVRAEFLRCRNLDYVRAAKALGLNDWQIMFRHMLPNAMVATLTFMPFILSGSVTTLTSLDFLGLGLPLGSASLGELLAQGKNNLHAPWLALSAFVTLGVLLSLLTFIGEAVRNAFDPRTSL